MENRCSTVTHGRSRGRSGDDRRNCRSPFAEAARSTGSEGATNRRTTLLPRLVRAFPLCRRATRAASAAAASSPPERAPPSGAGVLQHRKTAHPTPRDPNRVRLSNIQAPGGGTPSRRVPRPLAFLVGAADGDSGSSWRVPHTAPATLSFLGPPSPTSRSVAIAPIRYRCASRSSASARTSSACGKTTYTRTGSAGGNGRGGEGVTKHQAGAGESASRLSHPPGPTLKTGD